MLSLLLCTTACPLWFIKFVDFMVNVHNCYKVEILVDFLDTYIYSMLHKKFAK